jgi:hypothetical protein
MQIDQHFPERNVPLSIIHAALVEASSRRRLTELERRIRRWTAPLPWHEAGITRSTWYRRRNRGAEGATA